MSLEWPENSRNDTKQWRNFISASSLAENCSIDTLPFVLGIYIKRYNRCLVFAVVGSGNLLTITTRNGVT
jgi:hypothetical protein